MSERSAKGILLAVLVWFVIAGGLAVAYKFLVHPHLKGKLAGVTGSESQYKDEVSLALDSFSGYCMLRAPAFKGHLRAQGIKLELHDDQADYAARIRALRDGDVDMAVFTIDSLVLNSAAIDEFPATIVFVIDETQGADAVVARKADVDSIQALDDPSARFVLTPNSPSEFLARIVIANFSLPSLPEVWWEEADGAADVYARLRSSAPGAKRAWVLWEPWVSEAVAAGAQVLLDSSQLKGYIVDVMVARREFLRDRPELVSAVTEAYLRTAYAGTRDESQLIQLVIEDAKLTGSPKLSEQQAAKLVQGIHWKNTLENYAHLGLVPTVTGSAQHLEDIIANITDVLVKTRALDADPLAGGASSLFYDGTLRGLQTADFHPGKTVDIIAGAGPGSADLDAARGAAELAALSDEQWNSLVPVGELRVKPIAFGRGGARINIQSQRELSELGRRLASWPNYYLLVVGHARAEGDPEANLMLARERADATVEFLRSAGVNAARIKAKAAAPSVRGGSAQSVSFVVGQAPY